MEKYIINILIALGVVIILVVIEGLLANMKNAFVGLIPIVVVVTIMLGLGTYTYKIQEESTTCESNFKSIDSTIANVKITYNEDGTVRCFSDIYITNEKGEILDIADFDVIGEEVYCMYQVEAEYFTEKYSLNGFSKDIDTVGNEYVWFGNTCTTYTSFFFCGIETVIPLIAIYIVIRYIKKRKEREREFKILSILDLS